MFAGKRVRVFLKGQAKESYLLLKRRNDKFSKSIVASFERVREILKENPQYGNPVKKGLIPEELKRLGINNLYRVELAHFWRMLYTIEGDTVEIFVFIVKITNHKGYDRLFGYRKR